MKEHERILQQAIDGDAVAQNLMGARFAQGYLVEKDLKLAFHWYAQAVASGYTHAKFNLGTMLLLGEGGIRNAGIGMDLIRQAADNGDPSACNFISQCYASGQGGVEQDLVASEKWAKRAIKAGFFVEYGQPFDISPLFAENP